jgi:hypothetical protein
MRLPALLADELVPKTQQDDRGVRGDVGGHPAANAAKNAGIVGFIIGAGSKRPLQQGFGEN